MMLKGTIDRGVGRSFSDHLQWTCRYIYGRTPMTNRGPGLHHGPNWWTPKRPIVSPGRST